MRSRRFLSVTASLAVALFVVAPASRAVLVPVNFDGASQAFIGVTSAFGTASVAGSGKAFNAKSGKIEPFQFLPPTLHPMSLEGGFAPVNSEPKTIGPADFDITPTAINDIQNLSLNFLNGEFVPLVFNTLDLPTNSAVPILKNFTLDLSASFSSLKFEQFGAATLTPQGAGFGNFSVPGFFDFATTKANVALLGIFNLPVANFAVSLPGNLAGTYTITGPPENAKLTLDGTLGLIVPITADTKVSFSIGTPIQASLTATAGLVASVLVNVGFHFEQDGLVVPEPGSIALMAIGLAMSGAFAWRRRR